MYETQAGPDPVVGQAAWQAKLGTWREVHLPRQLPVKKIGFAFIVPLIMLGLVLALFASAGLLTTSFGMVFVAFFVGVLVIALIRLLRASKAGQSTAQLHLFDDGLVVRTHEGAALAFRWDDTELLRRGIDHRSTGGSVHTYTYTLLRRGLPAVILGDRGDDPMAMLANNVDFNAPGGIVRTASFEYPEVWGAAIEDRITRTRLPQAQAALAAGNTVPFGPVAVGPQGPAINGKLVPWEGISGVKVHDGTITVKSAGKLMGAAVPVSHVPNFRVFLSLVDRPR